MTFFALVSIVAMVAIFMTAQRAQAEVRDLRRRVDALVNDIETLRRALISLRKNMLETQRRTGSEVAETAAPATHTSPIIVVEEAPPVLHAAPPHGEAIPEIAVRDATEPEKASIRPAMSSEPGPVSTAPAAPHAAFELARQGSRRHHEASAPDFVVKAKEWLFGGNLVARLGLLILFLGVSFLLKYTVARYSVPIEFRLIGVVLADLTLLAWAWRIREQRPAISLPVQGTALAILMMVTFIAYRLYQLLPGPMAFALLLILTVFTCVLAVLQDALWLAVFGIVGGFAVPVVVSTGVDNRIGLFLYYALLNAGVFGIALRRSWRVLNLLSFVFTFVIGLAWADRNYIPAYYPSTQLFLILFVLFYVGIAIAYALRQAPRLRHYVDGTLVFGTPLLAFGMQYGLVHAMPFGAAFSALAFGLFYTSVALALWRRRTASLGLLTESFIALGIVFGTLALPLALDGRWTSAAWALEGAAMVWVGLRQRRPLAWMFGLLVQVGAWISFAESLVELDSAEAMHSNLWLGFVLLSGTAFFMATRFRAQAGDDEALLASGFLVVASIWIVSGAWTEVWLRTEGTVMANLLVASALAVAIGLYVIARKLQWQLAGSLALVVQGIAGITFLVLALTEFDWIGASPNLFDRPVLAAMMICGGAAFSSWTLARHGGATLGALSSALLLWSQVWWLGVILPTVAAWLSTHYQMVTTGQFGGGGFELGFTFYSLLLAGAAPVAVWLAGRLAWPALRWSTTSVWGALAISTLALLATLYFRPSLPAGSSVFGYAALWLTGEWLMRAWPARDWTLAEPALKLLHALRTVGPWLMIWPSFSKWITRYLQGSNSAEAQLLADARWQVSASWARFLPAWLMMAAIAWLLRRSRSEVWPVAPIARWYRQSLIPLGCLWALMLVALWNLSQDGAMAPLPYVPLINPLDLSSCFAMLLAVAYYRSRRDTDARWGDGWLPPVGAVAAYVWFNLALLRTVSNYGNIPYQFEAMFDSLFVQAMLSLVWSVTALLLMRHAVKRTARRLWLYGAGLLGVVVVKLLLIDLSNAGSVERIITFLGVGALMVGIGFLAPYPTGRDAAGPTESTEQ
ncbi:MAG: DUF2339 domain-containing protein [Anaerolineae bacterium]|nr:DUF2339 domain-containing protein [Anaerolineae bacterium]